MLCRISSSDGGFGRVGLKVKSVELKMVFFMSLAGGGLLSRGLSGWLGR